MGLSKLIRRADNKMNEEARVLAFMSGLKFSIREKLVLDEPETFEQAVQLAKRYENAQAALSAWGKSEEITKGNISNINTNEKPSGEPTEESTVGMIQAIVRQQIQQM
jgi:hypothetical protein